MAGEPLTIGQVRVAKGLAEKNLRIVIARELAVFRETTGMSIRSVDVRMICTTTFEDASAQSEIGHVVCEVEPV